MARGRRPVPDEIQALKGNPRKRRLSLKSARGDAPKSELQPAKPPVLTIPDFLTGERERAIFRNVVEDYLQRRVARPPDLTAYARWAHYLDRWIICKEALDGKATFFTSESRHGKLLRRHPLFKDQLDMERVLQSLEDRLGLNPVARQNIIRGLAALPPALGDLFGDEKPPAEAAPDAPELPEVPAESPLNFLHGSSRVLQ